MDALAGDAHLFMRSDEIERAWEIMDPYIAAVESGAVRPQEYPVSSEGPCCGDDFLAPMGRAWLPLGARSDARRRIYIEGRFGPSPRPLVPKQSLGTRNLPVDKSV